jgi:hypothetical protein
MFPRRIQMRDRFFNYSSIAPLDFRQHLEEAVTQYDRATSGSDYTPRVSYLIIGLITILSSIFNQLNPTEEKNPYKTASDALQITTTVVTLLAAFTVEILKVVAKNSSENARNLIKDGVQNKFFNTVPNFPGVSIDEKTALIEKERNHLHTDAVCERILNRNYKPM